MGHNALETAKQALVRLGTFPTPVEPLLGLWVKRDDASSKLYGGNKVRKLEYLLGGARLAGKSRLLALGAAGSHQVLATAIYGKKEGFEVDAVLVPQPASRRAENNLCAALAQGLRPTVSSSWPGAPAMVASRLGRDSYFIPLGGSNALGSLGFVDAAKELAAQIDQGQLPEPDVVVVAMGSGGTAAGLAVGFEAVGLRTRVLGVAISQPLAVLGAMARHLARKTAHLVGLSRAQRVHAVQRISVDKQWVGRGYGYPTPAGERAIQEAEAAGLVLDPTYTAKAFACALDLARREKNLTVLYWHTLSSAPMDPLLVETGPLPLELRALFR